MITKQEKLDDLYQNVSKIARLTPKEETEKISVICWIALKAKYQRRKLLTTNRAK